MRHVRHVMNRLDHRGHGPIAEWNPTNLAEVKTAEEVFGGQLALGSKVYDISDPESSTVMEEFNPEATEILVHAPMAGG